MQVYITGTKGCGDTCCGHPYEGLLESSPKHIYAFMYVSCLIPSASHFYFSWVCVITVLMNFLDNEFYFSKDTCQWQN